MKKQLYLILPNIRSAHNVGAMFRTADACGVDKMYLVGYTAQPPKPQIDKVSLGAETWMPWEHRKDLKRLITKLKKDGFRIVGLEKTKNSIQIEDLRLTLPTAERLKIVEFPDNIGKDAKLSKHQNIALIVGNEVDGISDDVLEFCDDVVHIPMYGKKESLNVSIAVGIALYVISSKVRKVKSS